MTHGSVWALLDGVDRALLNQLWVLLAGIDPVPWEVLIAADSLGQRIGSHRRVMVSAELIG